MSRFPLRCLLLLPLAAALGCRKDPPKQAFQPWQAPQISWDGGLAPASAPATKPPPAPLSWTTVREGDPESGAKAADRHVLRAGELSRRGLKREAIAELIMATRENPKDVGIRAVLARLLLEDGQAARAVDEFRIAWGQDPSHVDVAFGLAAAYVAMGRNGDARPLLEDLARKMPDDARVHRLLAEVRAGTGDAAAALKALQAAAAAEPDKAEAQTQVGTALARDGQFGEAAAALEKAAKAKPDDALAQLQLGTALAHAGQHEAAEKALVRATTLDPADRRGWHNLAVLREEKGDRAGAVEAYESLLKNVNNADPDGKLRERIEALKGQTK